MILVIKRLLLGVGSFIGYVYFMWDIGIKLGVGTSYDLAVFSLFAGVIGAYLLSSLIVTRGTPYRFVLAPDNALMLINSVLGITVLGGILGAATLLSGKVIHEEGFLAYLSMFWLPPLMMCFIPTLLMSWKAKEGDGMCRELEGALYILGLKLKEKDSTTQQSTP